MLPSRLLNEISLEDVDSERQKEDAKSETESETRHESAEELLDTYDRRRLHRRGATRQSFRDVVRERSSIRQRRNRSSLLGGDDDGNDHLHAVRHVAVSHEDTSAGAVHCFKDEFGTLFFVTFYHLASYINLVHFLQTLIVLFKLISIISLPFFLLLFPFRRLAHVCLW